MRNVASSDGSSLPTKPATTVLKFDVHVDSKTRRHKAENWKLEGKEEKNEPDGTHDRSRFRRNIRLAATLWLRGFGGGRVPGTRLQLMHRTFESKFARCSFDRGETNQ